jgi:hypothetical protein
VPYAEIKIYEENVEQEAVDVATMQFSSVC